MLNFALVEVLRDPLFVPTSGIHSKPSRLKGYLGYFRSCGKARIYANRQLVPQSFSILTWVKLFHKAANDKSDFLSKTRASGMKASASIHSACFRVDS